MSQQFSSFDHICEKYHQQVAHYQKYETTDTTTSPAIRRNLENYIVYKCGFCGKIDIIGVPETDTRLKKSYEH